MNCRPIQTKIHLKLVLHQPENSQASLCGTAAHILASWTPPLEVPQHESLIPGPCKISTAMGAVGSSSAVSLKSGFLSTIVNPRCTPLLIQLSLHPQTEPNNSKSTVAWLQQLLHSLLFIIYSGARTVTEPPTFLASFLEPITT